jgi:hypothetical protein
MTTTTMKDRGILSRHTSFAFHQGRSFATEP